MPTTNILRSIQPADLEAVHRLQRMCEAHDRIPVATPLEEFERWLDDPYLDLASDTRLAEIEGEAVAWARIHHRPSGVREERTMMFGAVAPTHRRRGIGSALLAWQIERSEEILRRAANTLPRCVRAWAYDFQESARRLYARHGMEPVRHGNEMLRDLDPLPAVPDLDRVTIVPWVPEWSEQARLAQNDAFADHWASTPFDEAAWKHLLGGDGTRLDLSFMALEGDRVVGVCRNAFFPDDEAVNGRREGWIGHVSVIRSHRRRGICSALVAASLRAFAAAGFTHSILGVDSENPTGAYRLYERLGYRPIHRTVIYERPV